MTRTRLRQLEQIENSRTYNDVLNQPSAEHQPGDTIGAAGATVNSFTASSTIKVAGNYVLAGVNSDDQVTITGGANAGTYDIVSLSYASGPNETTVVVSQTTITTGAGGGATATFKADPDKNLQRDLDHIRTQLRKLNNPAVGTTNWHDEPEGQAVDMFLSTTNTALAAGDAIDVGADYDAGSPYDLNVYLNGYLLQPSTVSGGVVTAAYDYQEVDIDGNLVEAGETGRKVKFNFNIISGDILQFVWNK